MPLLVQGSFYRTNLRLELKCCFGLSQEGISIFYIRIEQPPRLEGPRLVTPQLAHGTVLESPCRTGDLEPPKRTLTFVHVQSVTRVLEIERCVHVHWLRQHGPAEPSSRISPEPEHHTEIALPVFRAVLGSPTVVAPQAIVVAGIEPREPCWQSRLNTIPVVVVDRPTTQFRKQREDGRNQHRQQVERDVDAEQEQIFRHRASPTVQP